MTHVVIVIENEAVALMVKPPVEFPVTLKLAEVPDVSAVNSLVSYDHVTPERAGPALRAPGAAAGGTASKGDGKGDGELVPRVQAVVGVGPGVRDARAHAVSIGVTRVGRATMRGDGGESWCQ